MYVESVVPQGATLEQRLDARLRALLTAIGQVAEGIEDDDGTHALVGSERLQRLLGFARTDRRDRADGRL